MRVLYLLKVDFVKSVECRNEAKKNILPINNVTLKKFMKFFFLSVKLNCYSITVS